MKKLTKKEMLVNLKANYNLTADEIAFIDHEIELLEKRNSKKSDMPTAKQLANMDYKDAILEFLADHSDEKFTITDLWKQVDVLANDSSMSNQRVSSLVNQLKKEELVKREEIKRKAYFSIVVAD